MPPKKQRPRGKGGKGAGGAPAPPQQNPKGGGGKGNPNKGKGKGARGKGAQQGKGGKGAGGAPAPPVQPVVPNQQNPAAVQPAVAQGVAQNPVTVDTRPAININKKFDDTPGSDTMEWFNEYYPQYQFLSGSMRSTHVFLANDRAHAYAVLRRKQLGYVKDIGARPSEAKTGWHCICPRITVDDSHRWTKTTTKGVVTRSCFYRVASPEGEGMTEDDRWRVSGASGVAGVPIAGVPPHGVSICDHYAQDCTCRFAAATLVSVHSLYYIPRDDIVAMLHDRQRIQRIGRGPETAEPPVALYAYVHNFGPHSMKEGTFKGPNGEVEAVWSRDYNDPSGQTKIVMNVPGESKVYRHDALDWLQPNEGDVYSDPTGRKIGWMSQFTTPFGTMYKFVKVEASVESAATSGSAGQVVTDILSALDKARRGESHVSDSIPIGRIIGCHQAYDILYLSEVGAEDKAFPLTVYLGMRRKVVGAKRSTDGFQALLRFGKRALMDTSLPPGLRLEHAIDNLHLFALLATRVGMEEETLNQTRLGLGGVHEREYREHTLALSGERFPSAIERWSFGTIPLSAADLERILQTSRKIQRVTLAAVTSSPAILLMGVVSGAVAVRYSKVDPKVLRHELLMPLVKFRSYVSNFAFPSIWTMLSGAKHVKAAVIEPAVAATCSRERSPGIPLAMRWDTPSYVAPEHTDQRSLPSLAEAIMGRGRDDCWCMWDAIASCSFIGHALSHWRPDGGGSSSSRIVATASATGGETAPRSDRIGLVTMLGRGVSSLEGGLPPQKGVIGGVVRLPVSEAFPEGSRETMTGFDPSLPRDATEYELTHSAPLQVDQSIFSFLNIVVIAPVVEEWLKRVVGRTTGCGPVVSGVVYGAVEGVMKADMYGSLGIAVGWHAFIHGAMAALPYALGVGVHMLHNARACATQYYHSEVICAGRDPDDVVGQMRDSVRHVNVLAGQAPVTSHIGSAIQANRDRTIADAAAVGSMFGSSLLASCVVSPVVEETFKWIVASTVSARTGNDFRMSRCAVGAGFGLAEFAYNWVVGKPRSVATVISHVVASSAPHLELAMACHCLSNCAILSAAHCHARPGNLAVQSCEPITDHCCLAHRPNYNTDLVDPELKRRAENYASVGVALDDFHCKERVVGHLVGFGLKRVSPLMYRSCTCNEVQAAVARLCRPVNWDNPDGMRRVAEQWSRSKWLTSTVARRHFFDAIVGRAPQSSMGPHPEGTVFMTYHAIPDSPLAAAIGNTLPLPLGDIPTRPFSVWASRYTERERVDLKEAHEAVREHGLNKRDLIVKAFIKREWKPMDTDRLHGTERGIGDPRVIQGRSNPAKVSMGPWMWDYGKAVQRAMHPDKAVSHVTASGLTAEQVGGWFHQAITVVADAVIVDSDVPRWDAQVSPPAKVSMLQDYRRTKAPQEVLAVRGALNLEVRFNRGTTAHTVAQVQSGDGDTSTGNSMTHCVVDGALSANDTLEQYTIEHKAEIDQLMDLAKGLSADSLRGLRNLAKPATIHELLSHLSQLDTKAHFCSGREALNAEHWGKDPRKWDQSLPDEEDKVADTIDPPAVRSWSKDPITVPQYEVALCIMDDIVRSHDHDKFKSIVLGDDGVKVFSGAMWSRIGGQQAYSLWWDSHGFQETAVGIKTPNTTEFCSSRFWPVRNNGALTRVLGPKIGRVLAKTFYVKSEVAAKYRRHWLRAVCKGLRMDCSFVPVLRVVVERLLALTQDLEGLPVPTVVQVEIAKASYEDRIRARGYHEVCDETWIMMDEVYGLDKEAVISLEQEIGSLTHTGLLLDHPVLDRIIEADT